MCTMPEVQMDISDARILVVDDIPANLEVLCKILEDADYHLHAATSGEQALEAVERTPPDLILLDVMMPGIDGFETCRRLKKVESTQDIPVIFVTALEETASVVEGFRVGGVDYMVKPVQKEEVLVRVQFHLERAWLTRKLAERNRELAELNTVLDQQVEARTVELQSKARELEARDRISQHLLAVPSLRQTLELVLAEIADVVDLERSVIYLEEHGDFRPGAAIGAVEPGKIVEQDRLDQLTPSSAFQDRINEVRDHRKTVSAADGDSHVALIPILRDEIVLGLIEVICKHPVGEAELQTLSGFALQTAVAISDAQMQQEDNP